MTTKNTTTVVFVPFKNRSTIAPLKSENLKIANSAKRDSYTEGPTFCGQQILCHSRGPGVPVIPHLSCWGVEGVCGWGGEGGGRGKERGGKEALLFWPVLWLHRELIVSTNLSLCDAWRLVCSSLSQGVVLHRQLQTEQEPFCHLKNNSKTEVNH